MSDLRRLCDFITERKKALPPYSYEQRAAHDRAVIAIADELQANEGAVWKSDWRGTSIKLAGIRSTSTSSMLSALCNWQAAAEKRIAQGDIHDVTPPTLGRRPGIDAIIKNLEMKMPNVSSEEVEALAKTEWHRRNDKGGAA